MVSGNKIFLIMLLPLFVLDLKAESDPQALLFANEMMHLAGFDKFPKKTTFVHWVAPKSMLFEGNEFVLSESNRTHYVYKMYTDDKCIKFRMIVRFGDSMHDMLYQYCLSNYWSSMAGTAADKAKFPQLIVDDKTVVVYSKRGKLAELFHNNMYLYIWNTNCDAKALALALLYAGLKEAEANGQRENTGPESRDED